MAFGVLAVPAIARAQDQSGAQQMLQQANVAMADAPKMVSQEIASTSAAISASLGRTPATAPAAATAVETEAMATVSEGIESARTDWTASSDAPSAKPAPPPPQRPAPRPGRHQQRDKKTLRAPRSAAPSASVAWGQRVGGNAPNLSSIATSPAPRGHRSRPDGSPRSVSHRLPPMPTPTEDLSGTAQAGGASTFAPSVVAAAAAALLVVFLEILSRLLPRSAFRKPRRLALPPWHPG